MVLKVHFLMPIKCGGFCGEVRQKCGNKKATFTSGWFI